VDSIERDEELRREIEMLQQMIRDNE